MKTHSLSDFRTMKGSSYSFLLRSMTLVAPFCNSPCGSVVKNLPANAGYPQDMDSIPGAGNGNLLQCSCLENPMDRGAWRATVYGVTKSRTQLSTHAHMHLTLLLRLIFLPLIPGNVKLGISSWKNKCWFLLPILIKL